MLSEKLWLKDDDRLHCWQPVIMLHGLQIPNCKQCHFTCCC